MMRAIHISNEKRRDAQVAFDVQSEEREVRAVLPSGEEPVAVRVLKTTLERDGTALFDRYGSAAAVAQALIEEDPDVDIEVTGRKLRRTHRIYVDGEGRIAYHVNLYQVVRNPDGSERQRKDLNRVPSNVNSQIPLQWNRLYPKGEALRRFVFTRSYQLRHVNGATFDFLYNMARELHEAHALAMIGAGKKGAEPLLLNRGGQPYRGFLEGRVDGGKYCLILHLTDIELKSVPDETL